MKKLRLIFVSVIIAVFSGIGPTLSAQQTFRVYKHDGSMEVFFYTKIDSITFGNTDESGIIQNYVVTQNINTSDSVYRFLVSEIDSVVFTPIPTLYKSNAIRIEGRLRDYVEGADSLTLYLKKTIPDDLLPKVGDNIATLDCDEVLPYGFLGKVEHIKSRVKTIDIECSKPSLLDIFDSLGLEGSATSEDSPSISRSPIDVWPPRHYNLTIPSLKGSLSLSKEIEIGAGFSGEYDMKSYVELATEKCDVNWAFFITPMPFQAPQVYMSLNYTAQNTLSIGSSLSAGMKWSKEIPIEAIRNIRIPGVAAIFEFFEEGGIFVEIGGKIGLNGTLHKPFTTVMHFTYDNKVPASVAPIFSMIGREAKCETAIEGEAFISVGLYGKIGVAPLVKEMADIEAGFKVGTIYYSTLSLLPAATPIEVLNTEMFDIMDCDDFFRGDFSLKGEILAKVLNDKKLSGELEIGDILIKNPFFTRGVVPHFNSVTLTENNGAGILSAEASLSRKLMFEVPVGFALYDKDKNLIDKWWSPIKYKEVEGTTITHDFRVPTTNTKYILHPITRAFNENMVANPSASLTESDMLLEVQSPSHYANRIIKSTSGPSNESFWDIDFINTGAQSPNSPHSGILPILGNSNSIPLQTSCVRIWIPDEFMEQPSEIENFECWYKEEGEDIIIPSELKWSQSWEKPYNITTQFDNLNPSKKHTLWVNITNKSGVTLKDSIDFMSCPKISEEDFVDMGTGILWATKNVEANNYNELGNSGEFIEGQYQGKLPTEQDYKQLFMSCDLYWGTFNETLGYFVVSHNGNSLFFPVNTDKEFSRPSRTYYNIEKNKYSIQDNGEIYDKYENSISFDLYSIRCNGYNYGYTRLVK